MSKIDLSGYKAYVEKLFAVANFSCPAVVKVIKASDGWYHALDKDGNIRAMFGRHFVHAVLEINPDWLV